MSRVETTTNFRDSDGVDLGKKLITKDYLISVYPSIAQEIGKTPELWTWGNGSYGRLGDNTTTNKSTPVTTFVGGTNWKQVSAGYRNTAAIKTDGTLWTWGTGTFVQLGDNTTTNKSTPVTTFAGGTNWKQVKLGRRHCAAIKTDGTLWTWGLGDSGRLGDNTITNKSTPVTTFAGGTNWKQVSAGYSYTAAIKTDGTLWTWGRGNEGQLGDNTVTTKSTPVTTFAGGTDWKQVSAGNYHCAAIKTDGTLWTWGRGNDGILGDNTITNKSTPVTTFAGGTNWKQVSSGSDHCAAIKTDGTLWTWGNGGNGRLGALQNSTVSGTINNTSNIFYTTNTQGVEVGMVLVSSSPTLSFDLGVVTSISVNTSITFTNTYSTNLSFTGNKNTVSQLSSASPSPTSTSLQVGATVSSFVTNSGTTPVWTTVSLIGYSTINFTPSSFTGSWSGTVNFSGAASYTGDFILGFTQISTPVTTFAGGTNWKQVSSGDQQTAAIKTDGTLWIWGYGLFGQLGDNTATTKSTPVTTFAGGTDWKQVSGGSAHTAAIKSVDF
jgi:alpha-tubulin suppressor-like RCC1 family protein